MSEMANSGAPDHGVDGDAYDYARRELDKGCRPEDIRRCLIESGHTESQANRILDAILSPVAKTEASNDAIIDEAYIYVQRELHKGCRPVDIRRSLIQAGHSESQADTILETVMRPPPPHPNPAEAMYAGAGANNNMAIGGIVFLIGMVITVGSCMAAQGGGTYYLAYGAIIWGGIQFFRGALQKGAESRPSPPPDDVPQRHRRHTRL
jgi:hypothetical protein